MQPLDRTAILLMLGLGALILALLINGGYTTPRVREFSWQNRQIGAEDAAFILTFSRPMDRKTVEENLQIEPPLPGKISWAGRRLAYTLERPVPYGTEFEISLKNARDTFGEAGKTRKRIQPFVAQFQGRDRIFLYIGVEAEESGRLVMYNLTQQEKLILTPPELLVTEFKPFRSRDRILVAASDRSLQDQAVIEQQLYTVTTGIDPHSPNREVEAGKLEKILDNQTYQNLKFDVSPDGKTIVVQRMNRKDPADAKLWVIEPGQSPRPLESPPGGDFMVTPDSQAIAVTQGQGVGILPLAPETADPGKSTQQPLDFLPKFGRILSFAEDGTAAALVKFNTDYTRSLFVVTNQGTEKKLLDTTGSINDCKFSPNETALYCLLSELIPGETYQELPFIAAIDLKLNQSIPLLALPEQRNTQFSLSPDGLGILFDQAITDSKLAKTNPTGLRTNEGQDIYTSVLWLLPLPDLSVSPEKLTLPTPEELPFKGYRPQWMY